METNMKNGNTKPIDTFVELGTQVIVRDKVFSQDANDVGFRRAIAGVSTFHSSMAEGPLPILTSDRKPKI